MEYRVSHYGAIVSGGSPVLVDLGVVGEIDRAIGRDALAGLVHRHLDGVVRSVELVEGWCTGAQWDDVRREAHRMKGSAGTLGFVRLSELWVEVESRSAVEAGGDIKRLAARIRGVHRELRGWAASRFTSNASAA